MTVPAVGFSGPTFVQTPGNGVATVYSFPFLITAATDLAVNFIVNGVATLQAAGFTVNAIYPGAGQVVFTIPPPFGTFVDIRSVIPEAQGTNFSNLGAYFPESTTNALDRAVRNIADLYRLTYLFGIHGPDNESTPWPALPSAASRANAGLVFDSNGLPTLGVIPTSVFTQALFNSFLLNAPPLGQRTAAEIAANVTPSNFGYQPGNPNRYASAADWSAVFAHVNTLATYSDGWYRGDHAQHYLGQNCIVGLETMDDSKFIDAASSGPLGTAGFDCTAFGALTLSMNGLSQIAGGSNTAVGYASLQHNIEGSGNTALGTFTLNSLPGTPGIVTGSNSHNVAIGHRALTSLTFGSSNTGVGFQSLNTLATGNNNVGVGLGSLINLVNGNGNHVIGLNACFAKPAGDFTHAFGYQCLFSETAANISGISISATAVITVNTVTFLAIHPFLAGSPIMVEGITVGMTQINGVVGQILSIGGSQGAWTVTTNINTLTFSPWSAGGQVSPVGNTAFGYTTGFNLDYSGGNTIMGYAAGSAAAPGISNCLFGFQAGQSLNRTIAGLGSNPAASFNVAIGWQTLLRATSASNNVAIGQECANAVTTGFDNVCIGAGSGGALTTDGQNTFVGTISGVNLSGSLNTAVGYGAGSQVSPQTFTNTSSFGDNATPTASNQVTLGNPAIATLRCQQTTITALSDERFKKNIAPLDIPDAFLDEVQIVAYEWICEGMPQGVQMGVIAQQLDALQTKYGVEWLGLVDKSNPDRWEATPGKLLFPLIQKAQKQEARLKAIEAKLGL